MAARRRSGSRGRRLSLLPPGFRPRGAVERPGARRRRLHAERRTLALAGAALLSGGGLVVLEVVRAWPRRGAEAPVAVGDAAGQAVRDAMAVAVRGYRAGSTRENALLSLLASFTLTWGVTRAATHLIHSRGPFGPFRHLVVSDQHIHHFVPGIVLAFLAGGISIATPRRHLDPLLAVPFGVGTALTLDESALLLKLDDVYWTEEGVVSVQITLAVVAMVSALALALRVLRRGEEEVLGVELAPVPPPPASGPTSSGPAPAGEPRRS